MAVDLYCSGADDPQRDVFRMTAILLTSLVPAPSTLQVMQGFVDLWWRGAAVTY